MFPEVLLHEVVAFSVHVYRVCHCPMEVLVTCKNQNKVIPSHPQFIHMLLLSNNNKSSIGKDTGGPLHIKHDTYHISKCQRI
jgi:hypothetical protein